MEYNRFEYPQPPSQYMPTAPPCYPTSQQPIAPVTLQPNYIQQQPSIHIVPVPQVITQQPSKSKIVNLSVYTKKNYDDRFLMTQFHS